MSFEAVTKECDAFYEAHKEWETHEYIFSPHDELRTFLKQLIQDSEIQKLVREGTKEQIEALLHVLDTEILARFTVPLLTEILNALNVSESLQASFSKELVAWFRATGWKFPPFSYETDA